MHAILAATSPATPSVHMNQHLAAVIAITFLVVVVGVFFAGVQSIDSKLRRR